MIKSGSSAKFVAEILLVLRIDGQKPEHRQNQLKIFVSSFIINSQNSIITPNMSYMTNGMEGYMGAQAFADTVSFARQELGNI